MTSSDSDGDRKGRGSTGRGRRREADPKRKRGRLIGWRNGRLFLIQQSFIFEKIQVGFVKCFCEVATTGSSIMFSFNI